MRGHSPKSKGKNFIIAQESHITGHPHPHHFESTSYGNVTAQMNMSGFIDAAMKRKERFEQVDMDPRKAILGHSDREYKQGKSLFAERGEVTKKPLSKKPKTGK